MECTTWLFTLPCCHPLRQLCISLCLKRSKCGIGCAAVVRLEPAFGSFGQFHWNATVGKIVHWDSNSRAEHALWWLQSQWPSCWWAIESPEGNRDKSNGFIRCHANMFSPVNATALCRHMLIQAWQSGSHQPNCSAALAPCCFSCLFFPHYAATLVDFDLQESPIHLFCITTSPALRVLEPIPAVTVRRQGYTLDKLLY